MNYKSQGISTSPIPFNRVIGMINILFCYFVQPLKAAPSRNMTLISWSITIALMVFGWKHVYIIPELNSLMMIFAVFCSVMDSKTALSNNKID
jgi:hypothetical protein